MIIYKPTKLDHCPILSHYYILKAQKLLFIVKEQCLMLRQAESLCFGIVAIVKREEIKIKHMHTLHTW